MGSQSSQSPRPTLLKPSEPEAKEGYEIVLHFNNKAQLTVVNYPQNLTTAMANNHIAVAVLFMAQKLVEDGED